MQLSHSSPNPLAFESVSIASPTGCSLVRFRSQKLASFQLHGHVEQLLQDSSKGFCSFLDQLRQDLPMVLSFPGLGSFDSPCQIDVSVFGESCPRPLSFRPRPDQNLQKRSYATSRPGGRVSSGHMPEIPATSSGSSRRNSTSSWIGRFGRSPDDTRRNCRNSGLPVGGKQTLSGARPAGTAVAGPAGEGWSNNHLWKASRRVVHAKCAKPEVDPIGWTTWRHF